MKVLNIIETAYRATLEEQDDTIIWFAQSVRAAGGQVDLLLKGSTANYASRNQDASGLRFGKERQTQPPRLADDVESFIASGGKTYAIREDLEARGLTEDALVTGLCLIDRAELARLIADYDGVWYW